MNENILKFSEWMKIPILNNEETYELYKNDDFISDKILDACEDESFLVTSVSLNDDSERDLCVIEKIDTRELIEIRIVSNTGSYDTYIPDENEFKIL